MLSVILGKLRANCLYSTLKLVTLQKHVVYSLHFVFNNLALYSLCCSPSTTSRFNLLDKMLQTATLEKPQLSASTIDIVYQWCYSARLHLFSINPCFIKSIYIANESTNLSINGFPLKCTFEQARRKMIKKYI